MFRRLGSPGRTKAGCVALFISLRSGHSTAGGVGGAAQAFLWRGFSTVTWFDGSIWRVLLLTFNLCTWRAAGAAGAFCLLRAGRSPVVSGFAIVSTVLYKDGKTTPWDWAARLDHWCADGRTARGHFSALPTLLPFPAQFCTYAMPPAATLCPTTSSPSPSTLHGGGVVNYGFDHRC